MAYLQSANQVTCAKHVVEALERKTGKDKFSSFLLSNNDILDKIVYFLFVSTSL